MTRSDPRTVVMRYNDEVWNAGRAELIREIVADPLRRHHPGGTQTFSHDDMIRRVGEYRRRDPSFRVVARRLLCDGPFVTLIWDFFSRGEGEDVVLSSIEVFRVVDGRITEVWNPNAIAEQYPPGPWPEFD
ncbi:MAG: ester cyclase [Deltaproteobacteria bacterium]|nr:ester cyclase [Deltaproteobacteria bacterium]